MKKMRLIFQLVLLLLIMLTIREVRAYTYDFDSDFDPLVLNMWKAVAISSISPNGNYFIIAKNPNVHQLISYALIRSNSSSREITGYSYYKNSALFIFELYYIKRIRDWHFKRVKATPERKEFIDAILLPYLWTRQL